MIIHQWFSKFFGFFVFPFSREAVFCSNKIVSTTQTHILRNQNVPALAEVRGRDRGKKRTQICLLFSISFSFSLSSACPKAPLQNPKITGEIFSFKTIISWSLNFLPVIKYQNKKYKQWEDPFLNSLVIKATELQDAKAVYILQRNDKIIIWKIVF